MLPGDTPGSLGSVPYDAREVEASRLRQDVTESGIPIGVMPVVGPGIVAPTGTGTEGANPLETEPWRKQAPANNVVIQIDGARPFRRVVTILEMGTAAQVEVSNRQEFDQLTAIGVGQLPVEISLAPYQSLWLRQNTALNQDVGGLIEPRGPMR